MGNKTDTTLTINAKDNASGELKKLEHQAAAIAKKIQAQNKKTTSTFEKLKKSIDGAGKKMKPWAKGFGIVAGAAGGAASALFLLAKKTAEHNDAMLKGAEKLGTTTEFLSQMGFAAEKSGQDIGKVKDALTDLNEKMVNNEDKFKKWGVSIKDADGKLRDTESVLMDVSDRMSQVESSAGRVAMANDLMGGSGRDLVPVLQQGAAALKDMADEADRYGATVSRVDAEKSARFNDTLLQTEQKAASVARVIGTKLLPVIADYFDAIQVVSNILDKNIREEERITQARLDSAAAGEKIHRGMRRIQEGYSVWTDADYLKWADENDKIVKSLKDMNAEFDNMKSNTIPGMPGFGGLDVAKPMKLNAAEEGSPEAKAAAKALAKSKAAAKSSAKDAAKERERLSSLRVTEYTDTGKQFGPELPAFMEAQKGQEAEALQLSIDAASKLKDAAAAQMGAAEDGRDAQMQAAGSIIGAAGTLKGIFSGGGSGSDKMKGLLKFAGTAGAMALGGPAAAGVAQQGFGILGFSEGGVVPMTPGASAGRDSVPTMLMPGERVLSHRQRAEYERGGGGGGVTVNVSNAVPVNRTEMDRVVRDVINPSSSRLKRMGITK